MLNYQKVPPETIVDVGGFMSGTIKIGCLRSWDYRWRTLNISTKTWHEGIYSSGYTKHPVQVENFQRLRFYSPQKTQTEVPNKLVLTRWNSGFWEPPDEGKLLTNDYLNLPFPFSGSTSVSTGVCQVRGRCALAHACEIHESVLVSSGFFLSVFYSTTIGFATWNSPWCYIYMQTNARIKTQKEQ